MGRTTGYDETGLGVGLTVVPVDTRTVQTRSQMLRHSKVYMDNILMNWKHLTQAEFFRSMPETQLSARLINPEACRSRSHL